MPRAFEHVRYCCCCCSSSSCCCCFWWCCAYHICDLKSQEARWALALLLGLRATFDSATVRTRKEALNSPNTSTYRISAVPLLDPLLSTAYRFPHLPVR
jgi:hypothetical protein